MYLLFSVYKLKTLLILNTDSEVAILPVSVRLIDKPVNRKFSVNRLTVNIASMHQVLGGDLPRQQSDIALTHSSDVALAVILPHLICHLSKLYAVQSMKKCSRTLKLILSTFSIDFFHRSRTRRRITIFVRAVITLNFLIVLVI